jgi:hypothetical protein
MFKSGLRPIVFPQSEHLKLVGDLANLWGGQFDLPPVPFLSFVTGVALHDRAYRSLDRSPIGEMSDEEYLPIARQGFNQSFSDPVADIITRMHILRLVTNRSTPERQVLAAEMEHALRDQAANAGLPFELFQRIDRITHLCDLVSYNFCFEKPTRSSIGVYAKNGDAGQTQVEYRINAGTITLSPWPLRVDQHEGYLIGYYLDGYPQRLDPVITPYRLVHPG